MKLTLPANLSNKKTSKKLFLFFLILSCAITAFAQAPAITSFSPAKGPVGTLVTINGTNLSTPTAFSIGGFTALVVNNTGTVLTGFVMPGAVTGAISLTTGGGTATGSGNFTVTPASYPVAQQGGKLVGTNNTGAAQQGWSVAVSADGNTAIVGAPDDNSNLGAAWVYIRNNDAWVQQGNKLVGTGAVGAAKQGFSVALSADGNTAIVGGEGDNADGDGNVVGAAWIFTRSGGTWSQQGNKLVGNDGGASTQEGWSVALSADGNTAMVGGVADEAVGAAWVYTRSAGTWSQQGGKLVSNDLAIEEGWAVALSADGNTAIVSGLADDTNVGAAWIYVRNSGTWSQQGSRLVDAAEGNHVPTSVSLNADGNTAIVGGFNGGVSGAFVYIRSGTTWTEQGSIVAGNGTSTASESTSVSLSADGNTAIVSGTTNNGQQGAAWIYTRNGGAWSQQGSALPGGVNTDQTVQGTSACLSADGSTALVGGWADNSSQGAAWVFAALPAITSFSPAKGPVGTLVTINGTNLGTPTTLNIGGVAALIINNTGTVLTAMVMPGAVTGAISITTAIGTASAGSNFTITPTLHPNAQQGGKLIGTAVGDEDQGEAVAVSADGNTAIAGGGGDNGEVGAAWIYTRSGGIWAQQGSKLVGTGGIGQSDQGTSVSLSADGNTAIVGGFRDNNNQGAAWIYTRAGGVWSQQGSKLVGTGGTTTGEQGISVSLSADGNTAVVGGDGVWVYTRNGGIWSQQGSKLVATGSPGRSVAISADGNTIIAGGPGDNSNQGAAWVFIRSGNTWTQQGNKLVGTGNVGTAQQGTSVSLSADGNIAMLGGPEDNSFQGAAWVFTRSGSTWSQQGNKLVGSGNIGAAWQGNSVSLSADGNTAMEGGYSDNDGVGAAWAFTRGGVGAWSQQGSKLVGTGSTADAAQGYSLALSADGSTAFAGAYVDDNFLGASWVFIAGATNASLSAIKLTPASSLTNAGTAGSTTTYTTSVVNATAFVTVTPTAQDANATIKVNGVAVVSGTASGTIALAEGANTTITTVVTAQDGTTTRTYSIIITRAPSADATLSNLVTGTGTLAPAFAAGTTSYIANVPNATTGITVTPTSTDPNATITVNGLAVTSGTTSGNIAVINTISIVVKAQDGTTTDSYSIVVNRQSNNAALSTIKLTPAISLTNAGTSGTTTTYTASVADAIASVTVTPTAQDLNATIIVNGVTVTSGTGSGAIALAEGASTTITTVVTSQDGTATRTYAIIVTRAPSADASLSNLAISSGTLRPAFAAGTTSYIASVTSATTGITVTPTSTDPNAIIKVNGVTVASGTASGNIALPVGQTTINTIVTSQDGTTTRTYAITITRPSNNAALSTIALTPNTSLTNTGTVGSTTTYTTSVSNATASVKVTPTTGDPTATVKVNGAAVTSATASGSIVLAEGAVTTITTIVTAQDGTTTRTYIIKVTRASSANAVLSAITLTPSTPLTNTGTVGSTTTYTTTASSTTTSIEVTAVVADPNATIKVNGVTVASGTASGSIALPVGQTTITTVVTAQDGTTTRTYSITVTRPSNNASLSTIALTPYSSLTNAGTVGTTTTYTTSVANATTSVKVTPTTADANATVKVNGVAVTSGTASGGITLTVGANTITTVVTAQDGTTTHTYTITVTRAKSSNASLSTIKLTPALTLTNTGTSGGTTTYKASVSNATTSVTVTATTQDATATIQVNGVAVASGTASGSIALSVGLNIINTIVTAQDGTTARYSIDLTRATGPVMSLYLPVSVTKPADDVTIENDGVMVRQGVSPNGDGINDFLIIDGIIAYPDNQLTIIDRSGSLIYQAKGYNNISKAFDGHSSVNGRMQQPGTYFYSLDYTADGQSRHKTGFILLKY